MASAVIIDALLVRLTLVPALMQLAGRWNWAYPRWAERLTPRLAVEAPSEPHHEITRPSAIIRS